MSKCAFKTPPVLHPEQACDEVPVFLAHTPAHSPELRPTQQKQIGYFFFDTDMQLPGEVNIKRLLITMRKPGMVLVV